MGGGGEVKRRVRGEERRGEESGGEVVFKTFY